MSNFGGRTHVDDSMTTNLVNAYLKRFTNPLNSDTVQKDLIPLTKHTLTGLSPSAALPPSGSELTCVVSFRTTHLLFDNGSGQEDPGFDNDDT